MDVCICDLHPRICMCAQARSNRNKLTHTFQTCPQVFTVPEIIALPDCQTVSHIRKDWNYNCKEIHNTLCQHATIGLVNNSWADSNFVSVKIFSLLIWAAPNIPSLHPRTLALQQTYTLFIVQGSFILKTQRLCAHVSLLYRAFYGNSY